LPHHLQFKSPYERLDRERRRTMCCAERRSVVMHALDNRHY
jgi:hypothetical protein